MPSKTYTADPVYKHPDEEFVYYYQFTNVLPSGVTVVSAVVDVQKGDGALSLGSPAVLSSSETLADGTVLPANETVKVSITNGTDNQDYETTCLATLSDSLPQKPMLVGPIKVRK